MAWFNIIYHFALFYCCIALFFYDGEPSYYGRELKHRSANAAALQAVPKKEPERVVKEGVRLPGEKGEVREIKSYIWNIAYPGYR